MYNHLFVGQYSVKQIFQQNCYTDQQVLFKKRRIQEQSHFHEPTKIMFFVFKTCFDLTEIFKSNRYLLLHLCGAICLLTYASNNIVRSCYGVLGLCLNCSRSLVSKLFFGTCTFAAYWQGLFEALDNFVNMLIGINGGVESFQYIFGQCLNRRDIFIITAYRCTLISM